MEVTIGGAEVAVNLAQLPICPIRGHQHCYGHRWGTPILHFDPGTSSNITGGAPDMTLAVTIPPATNKSSNVFVSHMVFPMENRIMGIWPLFLPLVFYCDTCEVNIILVYH